MEMLWNPSEFDVERSLLQKAARRGNEDLTEKVVRYLINNDNLSWLRDRLAVITYEECWILGNELPSEKSQIVKQYKKLACCVKNKNAFGLAVLGVNQAYIGNEKQNNAIRSIWNAVNQPAAFWEWIEQEPLYKENKSRIATTKRAINKAKFPNDKAMFYAAAYLTVKNIIPEPVLLNPNNDVDFPYWISFDKHTAKGKEIIIDASKEINLDSYKGMKLAFYFAGSVCNQISDSPYWDMLLPWEMKQIGFSMQEAERKWEELKPLIIDKTKGYVVGLVERLNPPDSSDENDQMTINFKE